MNYRYLSLILAYTCLFPASALYLNGCQPPIPIEQTSNSDSQQVTPQPELSGIAAKIEAIAEPIMEELLATVAVNNPETAEANMAKIGQKYELIFRETQYLIPWVFLFGWQRLQNTPQPRLTAGRDSTQRKVFLSEKNRATTVFIDISSATQEEDYEELIEIDRATYEEALAAFAKTTELDPNFDTAWQEQGFLLNELARYPEALAAYDKAIALNSDNDRLHYFRGSLLMELGRYSEAADAFSKAIALQPSVIYYLSRMGAYMLMGDSQKAKADLERMREIDPEFLGKYPF